MMIDPKELRIGNLVLANGQIILVKDILQTGINLEYDSQTYTYEELEPIPIKEEWLIKLGAEPTIEFNNVKQFQLDEIKIELDKSTGEMFWTIREPGGWKSLKYVHKLQNIYFELSETGEELTIKE